ncbi:aspartate aminotransferase family protein [Mycolicibacterium neoaurum]|uniref:aspartate aminotransferase family protein n=1 Tax=Mycolicibacterium neoaurum TaxID=1795 RepID=UPI00248B5C21|nr:aspartate aminotransferase family protein [Mycolicibacterium neoaurum]MDO3400448.1 aspartate aminotransferase family protein [Mycolicibacterium neoaurum]WBP92592.1 aspartate aminotransferase family protein [Mycolicibacterium neoaurum]WBS06573.1 aspartate aminotransferase family protein [Mycolicibacterium neoaurum]
MSFSNIMDSNSYRGGHLGDPLIAARDRVLGPAYRLFYDNPVHLVRGQGTRLYDADGNCYLDAYNNVASVGHCHPHVIDSVTRQLGTLNTHTRYLHEGIVDYSQRLLATFPDAGSADSYQVMYACTGSEVNDLALRVAAAYTGARGVIVTTEAYHGNTEAVTAISPSLGGIASLGPHVRAVDPDLTGVAEAIADLQASGYGLSALIVDTIFSSDGIYPDRSVLRPAVEAVHAAGGVLIADEVQPGFGRTGDGMWGFDRHDVVPDLVTMGKPMANGMPVAAMVARSAVLAPFAESVPYFNTFGGNPVSMAAAAAVLDIIEDEKLIANAATVGEAMCSAAAALADPRITAVRGAGLYVGVELVDRETARRVVNGMRERRVLISVCGAGGNVLKIRPPMVFSLADVDWLIAELEQVLASLAE